MSFLNSPNDSLGENSSNDKKTKGISLDTLKKLLSVGKASEPLFDNTKEQNLSYLNRYSPLETSTLIQNIRVRPHDNAPLTQQGLLSFIEPIHKEIARVKFDNERFYVLAPEIRQAALILISSILSPNDLQEGELIFDLNISDIPENVKDDIIELLKTYFNTNYKLGIKLYDWYEEALFKAGSQPVLILPDIKLKQLIKNEGDAYQFDKIPSLESFSDLINKPVFSNNNKNSFNELLVGNENYFINKNGSNQIEINKKSKFEEEFINPVFNEFKSTFEDLISKLSYQDRQTISLEKCKAAIEDTTVKLFTTLKDGDIIKISENPEILRFNTISTDSIKKKLSDSYNNNLRQMSFQQELIVAIPETISNEGSQTQSHPIIIELPPESCIPIAVPSERSEHIGYFILIDESGAPLRATNDAEDNCNSPCGNGQAALAFDAMFGNSTNCRSIFSKFGRNVQDDVTSKVFEYMIEKYMKAKLKNIGLGNMNLATFNSISQVMLQRLLFHKKTILVFCPESLIVYNAFDYRSDGTGKGKLEDASFILHLRTTFLVASMIAMMNDAINHRTINLSLDDKVTDPEGLMTAVREMYIQKNMMKFSNNPLAIAKDIQNIALSMNVDGFAGLNNFKVEHTATPNQTQRVDNELLDQLTNMFINFLGIPHSALNALAETEYSRSIATVNLFFAKTVKTLQRIAKNHNDKFTQTYTKFSKPLRNKIKEILEKQENNCKMKDVHGNELDVIQSIEYVIDNISTNLPTPNISPDKAQYEELNNFLTSMETILNARFPNEMMPNEDNETQYAMQLLRAFYKSQMVSEYLNKIGTGNIIDVPDVSDISEHMATISNTYQTILNFNKLLKDMKGVLTPSPEGDMNTGMNSGISGDMDMGGMGGDDLGGGLNMDSSIPDMSSDTSTDQSSQTTQSTSSTTGNTTQTSTNTGNTSNMI